MLIAKKLSVLLIEGRLTWLFRRLSKTLNWQLVYTTSFETLLDDYLFFKPDAIALFNDYHSFEEFRTIAAKYPFRFIFAVDRNSIVDTKYFPFHYDYCEMIRCMAEQYKMTDEQIARYLNFIGLKPELPIRGKQFTQRIIQRYRLYKCQYKKDFSEWSHLRSTIRR